MPSKKKKYNARFPAGRIKKIMQSDEEIGKVAQAVPVIISRTLELFVESLLTKTLRITNSRNAKTLSTSHLKQCIMSEQRFDFLRELVKNIPDISVAEDEAAQSSPEEQYPDSDTPYDLSMPSTSQQARTQPSNGNSMIASSGNSYRLSVPNNGNNIANPVNYNKRSSTTTSVIMHTTSIVNANNIDGPPPKLARSESTPAQMPTPIAPKPFWRPIDAPPTQQRKRLKQQSQSMPQYGSSSSGSSSISIIGNNCINNHLNSKPQQMSAPIVNFDYCTKPIVKIDYTNLQNTKTTCVPQTSTAPLSAPVLGHQSNLNSNTLNSGFDFGTSAPIISIDLSNMMTPVATGSTQATISIGALPLTPTATITSPVTDKQNPLNAVNMKTTTATSVGSKNNALFELDEDYDNI